MTQPDITTSELKKVLENIHQPGLLDEHPWSRSLLVADEVSSHPDLASKNPGVQLLAAIERLFREMLPAVPPRLGKRLDTRWGEFGILAAYYFVPWSSGIPGPATLRDACRRVDRSIKAYVFDGRNGSVPEAEEKRYLLIGDESELIPVSTLSDWHNKGLQRLGAIINARESYLSTSTGDPAVIGAEVGSEGADDGAAVRSFIHPSPAKRRVLPAVMLVVLFGGLLWGGVKAQRIYRAAIAMRQDLVTLKGMAEDPAENMDFETADRVLKDMDAHLATLQYEAGPFLVPGKWLGWVPVYGGDLEYAGELMELADYLIDCTRQVFLPARTVMPFLDSGPGLSAPEMVDALLEAQPQFLEARSSLELARQARNEIDLRRLSPEVREMMGDIDPILGLYEDGLDLALALPTLLGASNEGPKTYLLLAQNEDELRPTGGFITAVGSLVLQDGSITSLVFANSGDMDDWTKPYPPAPWQLENYMNSSVLVLRDSNWYTDFPTAALYAEMLYSYTAGYSVDGVIAFDQHALVLLLDELGPLKLKDNPVEITADNVIEYMRSAKTPPADGAPAGWDNKAFISEIAEALISNIYGREDVDWQGLFKAIHRALDERHILMQMDNGAMSELLNRHGWNGMLDPGNGDFLMVVDTNVGFNKTDAVVETELFYDVDLTSLDAPTGSLLVVHANNAVVDVCRHWGKERLSGEEEYPIDDCYWDYMRVYLPEDAVLLGANLQQVPPEWMILNRRVPPRMDELEDDIRGVRGYGTMLVVPGGGSQEIGLTYALPARILGRDLQSGTITYQLTVQKQPGTKNVPIRIRVHFPNGLQLESVSSASVVQENNILITASLQTDFHLEVVFIAP